MKNCFSVKLFTNELSIQGVKLFPLKCHVSLHWKNTWKSNFYTTSGKMATFKRFKNPLSYFVYFLFFWRIFISRTTLQECYVWNKSQKPSLMFRIFKCKTSSQNSSVQYLQLFDALSELCNSNKSSEVRVGNYFCWLETASRKFQTLRPSWLKANRNRQGVPNTGRTWENIRVALFLSYKFSQSLTTWFP